MQAESKIPVFVFPNSVSFMLEDKTTHKQILSLYNPYDYTVKYRGRLLLRLYILPLPIYHIDLLH